MPNQGTLHRTKTAAQGVVRDLRADGWNARVAKASNQVKRATGKAWVAVLGNRNRRN